MGKGRKESQRKPPRAGGSATSESSAPSEDEGGESGGNLQELLRRAIALGFSGLFTTEATIRGALGDTVPKDWVDFASEQGDRTRREIIDRMAREFGRVIENLDTAALMRRLLEGHALEVNARFRLVPVDDEAETEDPKRRHVKITETESEGTT
jgi:hypothetical protein